MEEDQKENNIINKQAIIDDASQRLAEILIAIIESSNKESTEILESEPKIFNNNLNL